MTDEKAKADCGDGGFGGFPLIQQGTLNEWGTRVCGGLELEADSSEGNDRKKNKGNGKGRSFATLRMTSAQDDESTR